MQKMLFEDCEEEAPTLESLPYEVGLRVCRFLEPADLLHLALTSSHTHALASDHSIWRELCMSAYRKPNLSPAIRTKIDLTSSTREIDWKRFYIQRAALEKRWVEENYVIHKIPHEGTTVIQVLRTNTKIHEAEDEDKEEEQMNISEGEGEGESEGKTEEGGKETKPRALPKKPGKPKAQNSNSKKKAKKGKDKEEKIVSELPQLVDAGGEQKTEENARIKNKSKRSRRKQKKSSRGMDDDEELVDWGWDFVTGDDEGQVILWSGREFKEKKVVEAHDFIWWLEVHSDTCITASTDGTAKLIDLNKAEVTRTYTGHPTALWCVDFSLEEDYVVTGGQNGHFIAWTLSTGEELASHKFINGLFDVRCVVTDLPIPRRKVLHSASAKLDEEGEEHTEIEQASQEDMEQSEPHASGTTSLTSSSAGIAQRTQKMQRLAICTAVGETDFYLFDVDANEVIGAFVGHTATVTTVKRDGDLVLSGSDDKTIRVWDLATLKCLHTFSVGGIVYDIRLCENKLVAGVTGSQSSFLRVWDYVKKAHMFDIPVSRVPRRIFSITVLPDRIYCSTNEHITVVDFRDVEGVEVKCKPKKEGRDRRDRDNCSVQ